MKQIPWSSGNHILLRFIVIALCLTAIVLRQFMYTAPLVTTHDRERMTPGRLFRLKVKSQG